MPNVDEVLLAAESLSPDERLSLIARLWKSLPQESWPRATAEELVEADRVLSRERVARNESVSWPMVERILADSVRSSRPKVYSAPRRFDISTLMVVTAGYAILFAVLNLLSSASNQAAGISVLVGVFVTLVGVGQATLFGGHRPRTASILVGAILTALITVGSMKFISPRGTLGMMLPFVLAYGAISGIIYGYLAGVLVGGVFLVADVIRRLFKRAHADVADDTQAAASPFDGS
jgi:hypothetical protein